MSQEDPVDALMRIMRPDRTSSTATQSTGPQLNINTLLDSLVTLEATLQKLNQNDGAARMVASMFDLRVPSRVGGLDIVESKEVPRYVLPEEIMPGVPWPPGFRDGINKWSREFLGTTNLVPRGHAFVIGGSHVVMRSEDVVKISNL